MCGRFTLTAPGKVAEQFHVRKKIDLSPRYNIAPGQQVAAVRTKGLMQNELVLMRWGLIPSRVREEKIGYRLINARAETVLEKPSFRAAIDRRRCLLPADGFYEWKQIPGRKMKQPYFIRLKNRRLFAIAGLWETWRDPESGRLIQTCTIVTTAANTMLAGLHDRMPAIIDSGRYGLWLDLNKPGHMVRDLLKPYDPYKMTAHPVSGMCNDPKNDAPGCVRKVGG